MPRNIELKAHCPNLRSACDRALIFGAYPRGRYEQTDTYFHAPHGRLKLRQTTGHLASNELIWYNRPDLSEARACDYHVLSLPDPQATLAILTSALGVRGQVKKTRQLLSWRDVRIHLDEVQNLGTFIEFEAIITPSTPEPDAHRYLAMFCQELSIPPQDIVPQSYSDLLKI